MTLVWLALTVAAVMMLGALVFALLLPVAQAL